MIVEFCKYGNLSNYLRRKRDDFIVYKVSLEVNTELLDGFQPRLILNCARVLFSARTVRWCHRYQESSWASWWSGVWRVWPALEAQPAPASSKIRATATLRKRKKVPAKHGWLPFNAHSPPLRCLSSPAVSIPSPLLLPSCTGTTPTPLS